MPSDVVTINSEKSNILVIEDNINMLNSFKKQLENTFNIFLAISGRTALEKLSRIPKPDLIISDIMMDDMDGYELLQNLHRK